jgi:hypothetical protein
VAEIKADAVDFTQATTDAMFGICGVLLEAMNKAIARVIDDAPVQLQVMTEKEVVISTLQGYTAMFIEGLQAALAAKKDKGRAKLGKSLMNFMKLAKGGKLPLEAFVAIMLTTSHTKVAYNYMVEHNLPLPFSWICFRPRRTYQCGSVIACRRGEELGRTFYGYPDFQWANDVIGKTMTGHLTFHHSSAVTNPNAVMTVHDVIITNYIEGESATLSVNCTNGEEPDAGSVSIFAVPVLNPYFGDDTVSVTDVLQTRPLVFGTGAEGQAMQGHVCQDELFTASMEHQWKRNWRQYLCEEKADKADVKAYVEQFGSRFNTCNEIARFCFQEIQYVTVNGKKMAIDEQGHIAANLRRPGGAECFKGYFVHMPKLTLDYYV